jgi:hypothetical protein
MTSNDAGHDGSVMDEAVESDQLFTLLERSLPVTDEQKERLSRVGA